MNITFTSTEWKQFQGQPETFILYLEKIFASELENGLTADQMNQYSACQITLLAYLMFRHEMLEGGFIQLIYNGYASFIFLNPFAKAMRLWGLKNFSKFLYTMREMYMDNKDNIENREFSDDDFMALYEMYPEFENVDDDFVEAEPEITKEIANFALQNPQELGISIQ